MWRNVQAVVTARQALHRRHSNGFRFVRQSLIFKLMFIVFCFFDNKASSE